MGVVYLAERSDLGTQVAIKFLRDAWLSPARRERFASEQRTLAQLNHSSIARLYDADTLDDGTPWFVMEYVEGVPLTEYCRRNRVLDRTAPAIISRRLRSGAIRASACGDSPRLEAFEYPRQERWFGAPARFRHRQTNRKPRDAGGPNPHGLRLMTPAYACARTIPRRARRHPAPMSIRSASFSTNCSPGRLPFDLFESHRGRSGKNYRRARAGETFCGSQPRERIASSPECDALHRPSKTAWADLDVLCLTAMHKDAARRYQSVEALIRDIDHYLNGEPSRSPSRFACAIARANSCAAIAAP